MGYACPVCGDPQADGEHLANHLAFTAMLGDADHEDWLDEHVPDWGDTDPAELADRVTDRADEREFPQVFEDTTGDGHDHAHDSHGGDERGHALGSGVPDGVAPGGVADPADLFAGSESERDPSEVLSEARELTAQRRTNDDGERGEEASDATGTDDASGENAPDDDGETDGSDAA